MVRSPNTQSGRREIKGRTESGEWRKRENERRKEERDEETNSGRQIGD